MSRLKFSSGRIVGVEGVTEGKPFAVAVPRGSVVVLAAGAINTPALLLRSGVGGVGDLGERVEVVLPGVGHRIQVSNIISPISSF